MAGEGRKRPRNDIPSPAVANGGGSAATPTLGPTRHVDEDTDDQLAQDRGNEPPPFMLAGTEEVLDVVNESTNASATTERRTTSNSGVNKEEQPGTPKVAHASKQRAQGGSTPPAAAAAAAEAAAPRGKSTATPTATPSKLKPGKTSDHGPLHAPPPPPPLPAGFSHKRTAVDDYLLPNTIVLVITTLSGRYLSVEVHPHRSLRELRSKLQTLVGIPVEQQQLHLNASLELPASGDAAEVKTLEELGFTDSCTVHVVLVLPPQGDETRRTPSKAHPIGAQLRPGTPPPSPFRSSGLAQTLGGIPAWMQEKRDPTPRRST